MWEPVSTSTNTPPKAVLQNTYSLPSSPSSHPELFQGARHAREVKPQSPTKIQHIHTHRTHTQKRGPGSRIKQNYPQLATAHSSPRQQQQQPRSSLRHHHHHREP
ncbi:hypothetical protein N658DRAFT_495796 [Parathielavia hyrcaniae]|uniref:Uncharacterized protein n=1 Tax=Parathielavia hyrcaniae TaxID=113614 RepID=A0AAN6Q1H9_9PEZI|nr:hypothetical protein N658DRAFT_495796 [Parathielavia hyrcaniae]